MTGKPQDSQRGNIDERYGWQDERRQNRTPKAPSWRGPLVAVVWVLLVAALAAAIGAG